MSVFVMMDIVAFLYVFRNYTFLGTDMLYDELFLSHMCTLHWWFVFMGIWLFISYMNILCIYLYHKIFDASLSGYLPVYLSCLPCSYFFPH